MSPRNCWLAVFSLKTWQQFCDAGGRVAGFPGHRWQQVQQIRVSDYLLCYLRGVSRWVAVLEVITEPYVDTTPIWGPDQYPCRVGTRTIVALTPETGVPIREMQDHLSIFCKDISRWGVYVRVSPRLWDHADAEFITKALLDASQNPVSRPLDTQLR